MMQMRDVRCLRPAAATRGQLRLHVGAASTYMYAALHCERVETVTAEMAGKT